MKSSNLLNAAPYNINVLLIFVEKSVDKNEVKYFIYGSSSLEFCFFCAGAGCESSSLSCRKAMKYTISTMDKIETPRKSPNNPPKFAIKSVSP